MPEITFSGNELKGTDARYISLVSRGANRIPFRIIKEDQSMLDLNSLGRKLFKTEAPAPQVVGALFRKGIDEAGLARSFKASGLDAKAFQKQEQDDFISVTRSDAQPSGEATVVLLTDDVGLVVEGLEKMFKDWDYDDSDFGEALRVSGYVMGLSKALEVLHDVSLNSLWEARSPGEAADRIASATEQFKSYVEVLTNGLPDHVFKIEETFLALEKETAAETDDVSEEGAQKGDEVSEAEEDVEKGSKKGKKYHAKKGKMKMKTLPSPGGHAPGDEDVFGEADEETEESARRASEDDRNNTTHGSTRGSSLPSGKLPMKVRKNEGDDEAVDREEEVPEDKSGAGAQTPEDFYKESLEQVLSTLQGVQKAVEGLPDLQEQVKDLSATVDGLKDRTTKAEKTLEGTVFSTDSGDAETQSHQGEADTGLGLIDTAYRSEAA